MSVHEILEMIPTLTLEERAQVKALLDSLPRAPEEPDTDERAAILRRMVERMKANPIPADAPLRFTREGCMNAVDTNVLSG